MRSVFMTLLTAIAFSPNSFALPGSHADGSKPESSQVCGILVEPGATNDSTTLNPTHIRVEKNGEHVDYALDSKSRDRVQEADHLVNDRVCLVGELSKNPLTIHSAHIVSER